MPVNMRVLGIDPGYERLGIAIIERSPNTKDTLLYSDCIRTSKHQPFNERLLHIGENIERTVLEFKPDTLAYERLYFNTNQKTAMGVSEVRGVISFVCSKAGLHIYEYTPAQIKVALSGWGKANKHQVADMVTRLISLPSKPKRLDDEYDAIAVALTHLAHIR